MLLKPFVKLVKYVLPLAFLGAAVATPHQMQAQENTSNRGKATFFCGTYQGEPATIADQSNRNKVAMIVWRTSYFERSNWTPQRRCEVVSLRFQNRQNKGILNYMVGGRLNEEPVICASRKKPQSQDNQNQKCSDDNLLFTLRKTDNPNEIIQHIYDVNHDRSDVPLVHNNDPRIFSENGTLIGLDIDNLLRISPVVNENTENENTEEDEKGSCDTLFGPCSE